jgi:hypothetical protein
MKVDARGLKRALKKLPAAQRKHMKDALEKSANETMRFARIMVPTDSGDLKSQLHIVRENDGLTFSVEAAKKTKEDQIKARAVHAGRRRGNRGTTEGVPYMRRAQKMVAGKHKGRVTRALSKAKKEVGL